ncbi:hypothetical protein [Mesorhizobium kowhaii]|uniref:Uncharacterized protein n=1 Tax=Mesorhizobium kowhaii TaxID=1300272 RepID=A0A2W7C1S4_9HYPH|nr:hypothetical protein [Mesorhizobium kowhaii]PZV36897.1 hypothetical protein B5V02_19540 [Mesorhizobium kowhaii]
MNMRRGFWRLWLVASAAWVMLVFAIGLPLVTKVPLWQVLPAITGGWQSQRELPEAQAAWTKQAEYDVAAKAGDRSKIDNFLRSLSAEERHSLQMLTLVEAEIRAGQDVTEAAFTLSWLAIVPPLVLLVVGAAIGWAVSGFRRP